MPGKSTLHLTIWDIRDLLTQLEFHPEDRLKVRLVDYDRGIYSVDAYPAAMWSQDRLRARSLYVALENELLAGLDQTGDTALSLEKQILQGLFHLDGGLGQAPAFSLTGLVESIQYITVVRNEEAGVYFALDEDSPVKPYTLESVHRTPRGGTGSLQEIFEDMGLAFSELEFKAILYSMMGTEEFNLEEVFDLLFGAKKDAFYDQKQHQAFYRMLRKMLNLICDELKGPEPRLVCQLRNKIVYMKLRLIEMLRYIEAQREFFQIGFRIEVARNKTAHFPGDLAVQPRRIKTADTIDAADAVAGIVPEFLSTGAVGADNAQPGKDDSS